MSEGNGNMDSVDTGPGGEHRKVLSGAKQEASPGATPSSGDAPPDVLVRAYRMYQKMVQFPHLLSEIRKLFLEALAERGASGIDAIWREAEEILGREGLPPDEDHLRDYADALIDLHFARHFPEDQIDNYINLARKKDAFHTLHRVVNTEGVTTQKIIHALKEFCQIPQGSLYISPGEAEGVRVALISHFVSSQLPFVGVAKKHITIRDIDEMIDHTFWSRRRTGRIGGKAAGMFLASKIVLPRFGERDPELDRHVAIPESYYFNSGIFSDFIDYNHLYSFHSQKYKDRDTIEREYADMTRLFDRATFPPDVMEDFQRFLERIGEHPLVLRSSSLLEDNVGYTFSGKYDSVFIANQGDMPRRLGELMWGLKRVLMSTFSPAAIFYRRDHDLIDFDERMSVLVQKVVGRRFGKYFFPFAAGVAFSQNTVTWSPRIVREEGMVRMVVGLGTRAVDRIAPDYPRMAPLSHPTLRPEVTVDRIKKYSQRMIDVLDLEQGGLHTLSVVDLFRHVPYPELFYALSTDEGGHLAAPLFKNRSIDLDRSCVTFDNFITRTPFVRIMKKILRKLEQAYGRPVDIEFAWDSDRLYLLQCRSLAEGESLSVRVSLPKTVPPEQVLFRNHRGVSSSIKKNIEYIVYVDPKAYALMETYEARLAVGRVVGQINRLLEGKRFALFGPTRWGSNDVKYGVKVGYEDINHTQILAEIAFEESGSTPEVSYGTHFFNDLIEARIVPVALFPDEPGAVFREGFFLGAPNTLASLAPALAGHSAVVRVIDVPSCTGGRLLHVYQDGQGQDGLGFFAFADEQYE